MRMWALLPNIEVCQNKGAALNSLCSNLKETKEVISFMRKGPNIHLQAQLVKKKPQNRYIQNDHNRDVIDVT